MVLRYDLRQTKQRCSDYICSRRRNCSSSKLQNHTADYEKRDMQWQICNDKKSSKVSFSLANREEARQSMPFLGANILSSTSQCVKEEEREG